MTALPIDALRPVRDDDLDAVNGGHVYAAVLIAQCLPGSGDVVHVGRG